MATITTRAEKGSPLTTAEMDTNLKNLNKQLPKGVSFGANDGILTITREDETTLTVDLDGRYLLGAGGTISGNVNISGDLTIGQNGAGNSDLLFYDDNSDTQRGIRWNDSANTFQIENNDGVYNEITNAGNISNHITNNMITRAKMADDSVGSNELHNVKTLVFYDENGTETFRMYGAGT